MLQYSMIALCICTAAKPLHFVWLQVSEDTPMSALYVVRTCSVMCMVSSCSSSFERLSSPWILSCIVCFTVQNGLQTDLCLLADIPAGVVNIIPGKGDVAGAALAAHPGIDHVRQCTTGCRAMSVVARDVGTEDMLCSLSMVLRRPCMQRLHFIVPTSPNSQTASCTEWFLVCCS